MVPHAKALSMVLKLCDCGCEVELSRLLELQVMLWSQRISLLSVWFLSVSLLAMQIVASLSWLLVKGFG